MTENRNCLSYWFPKLRDAGLPVPETRIVKTDVPLIYLCDGKTPDGSSAFIAELESAAKEIGLPCFLRTGQFSNKWAWNDSCFLADMDLLERHVADLVEASEMVDMLGLPHNVWVVRKLIPTTPLFHAFRGRMPITREFRFFVRDGVIEHTQPYWPAGSIRDEQPDDPHWENLLRGASDRSLVDIRDTRALAIAASNALPGFWSVDLLQDSNSKWWITDCAEGERSFRWDPNDPPKKRPTYTGPSLIPDDSPDE